MASFLILTHQRRKPYLISSVPCARCHAILHAQLLYAARLFVHYRERSIGQPLSAQRLSHGLGKAVSQAYFSSGLDPPENIKAHGTRDYGCEGVRSSFHQKVVGSIPAHAVNMSMYPWARSGQAPG
ncbi:hypothetical protein CgunFtcFv8_019331 [Champsocephalus gunnari]|uniref:Uncharacterized protein n=1 Tax=Champsocephalus gunnari TaxID=52237 RepID=A0AAN8DHK5_CHAGU|nr:hypothetical protein CgunFtcFv8_019331 [Champsocephalus gunnari]